MILPRVTSRFFWILSQGVQPRVEDFTSWFLVLLQFRTVGVFVYGALRLQESDDSNRLLTPFYWALLHRPSPPPPNIILFFYAASGRYSRPFFLWLFPGNSPCLSQGRCGSSLFFFVGWSTVPPLLTPWPVFYLWLCRHPAKQHNFCGFFADRDAGPHF